MSKNVEIHPLKHEHIPFAMELKNIAGWNQTEADWQSYLQLEQSGCFLAQVTTPDEDPKAGTATAISYDGKVGWIGMVLVHPSKRNRGVGTVLMEKSIQYLHDNEVPCIKLDATQMGRKVYVPLGFVDEYEVRRYESEKYMSEGLFHPMVSDEVYPISTEHMDALSHWDAEKFGVMRKKVLEHFQQRDPSLCYWVENNGQIRGYMMAHQGYEAYQIGPFVAEDEHVAEALFRQVLKQINGHKVFLDVPVPNADGIRIMEKYRFTVQRSFTRMYLGDNAFKGQPKAIFATSGAELG